MSLTVEGGVSLIGPHCPGNVRLFCEGVHISFLRWSYNGYESDVIETFDTTDSPTSVIPLNHAMLFPRLVLSSVHQATDPRFANFTSILTVDLRQLQNQHVLNISCGASNVMATVPVDVRIIQPSPPKTPNITAVTATYQYGRLSDVSVSWRKLVCTIIGTKLSMCFLNLFSIDMNTVSEKNV